MKSKSFFERYLLQVVVIGLVVSVGIGVAMKYTVSVSLTFVAALGCMIIILTNAAMVQDVLFTLGKEKTFWETVRVEFAGGKALYFAVSTLVIVVLCIFVFSKKISIAILLFSLLLVFLRAVILAFARLSLRKE